MPVSRLKARQEAEFRGPGILIFHFIDLDNSVLQWSFPVIFRRALIFTVL